MYASMPFYVQGSINDQSQYDDQQARIAAGVAPDAMVTGVYGVADNFVYADPYKKFLPSTVQDPRYATPANPDGVRITTPTTVPAMVAPVAVSYVPNTTTAAAAGTLAAPSGLNVNRIPNEVMTMESPTATGGAQQLPENATTAPAPTFFEKYGAMIGLGLLLLLALFLISRHNKKGE
jgi:hypothetical protein